MKLNSFIFFTALIIFTNSCDGQKNKSNFSENELNKMENKNSDEKPINENQISNLKISMLEYMEMVNPSYTKNDVEECVKILNDYTSEISKSKSKDEGMKITKLAVEKLNELNKKCNFQLIETSEREQIVEIIILESSKKGYNKPEEDITENLREW